MAESTTKEEEVENPEIHFEPIVKLADAEVKTLEDNEDVMLKMRAKLFRYDTSSEDGPEWKERGVGDVKILKHKTKGTCRLLMRRDKTFKICANHLITTDMKLAPNCGSDRAWVWNTLCDFADEEPKQELLAIRFANAENAQKFKSAFEEAQKIVEDLPKTPGKGDTNSAEANEGANDDKTDSVQSGGDAESASKDDDSKKDSTESDKTTDSVADKLSALSVGETKSDEADTESKGSPEAER